MRQVNDRCGKWLIGQHGDAILKLGCHRNIRSWRAVQPETVAPRRLPNGLIAVFFGESTQASLFLIEIETYASSDANRQVFEDLLVIALDRGKIPDAVSLILRPKGQAEAEGRFQKESAQRTARLIGSWQPIELWKLDAEDLLASNDVGVLPGCRIESWSTNVTGSGNRLRLRDNGIGFRLIQPRGIHPIILQ